MAPVHELIDTWASVYSNSPAIRSAIAFVHIGGLVSGGGCAVAADVATLRAFCRGREAVAAEIARLHDVHRIVIGSLLLVMASGLLLMLADFDAYLSSTAFWIKMALVAALVANGAVLVRAGDRAARADSPAVGAMRLVSFSSLALWFATTLLGAMLPNVL
jgi:hypothetical protein